MKKLITYVLLFCSLFCTAQKDNVRLVVIPNDTKEKYVYNKTTYEIFAYITDSKTIVFDSLATIKILFADLQNCRKESKEWEEKYYALIEKIKKLPKCCKKKVTLIKD